MLSVTKLVGACGILTLTLIAAPSYAHEIKLGQLVIVHPWLKQSPDGKVAFACMKIINKSQMDERLVAATLGSTGGVQLSSTGGMVPFHMTDAIVIPAGQTVRLHANPSRTARFAISSPLFEGSTISGSLTFEKAGTVEIEYEVGD